MASADPLRCRPSWFPPLRRESLAPGAWQRVGAQPCLVTSRARGCNPMGTPRALPAATAIRSNLWGVSLFLKRGDCESLYPR